MNRRANPAPAPDRSSPGQTLVICALLFTVLLGALGLALDGGYLFIQRRSMQNAADAASLAGAEAISRNLTDTQVTRAVLDAAARNGVPDALQVTCTFITNAYSRAITGTTQPCSQGGAAMATFAANYTGVLVRTTERHETYVFRALGTPQAGTAAEAAARVERPVGVTGGPFMVCGIDTTVTNAAAASYAGGIYQTSGTYAATQNNNNTWIRTEPDTSFADCQGDRCAKVPDLAGAPLVNTGAYALEGANLVRILTGGKRGPVYLIHDSNGISVCNDNSSSFKGINTNVIIYDGLTFPAFPNPGYNWPPLTTGTVASVKATVEGINGCQVGAPIDNCIMILPVCDASGPGGTGSTAILAVRSLEAFYVKEAANGSHTGELIRGYNIVANSDATYIVGSGGVTSLRLIK